MPHYYDYLKLDQLLSLQRPLSEEHDETLFIVIHQVYELWFKEVLHELDYFTRELADRRLPPALATLKRVLTVLKTMVAQIDILETMTPLDFLSFRDRLEAGSGFQSYQFRELEFLLGLKDRRVVERFSVGTEPRARLETRYAAPTVWDAFLRFLAAEGFAVPHEQLTRDVTRLVEPDARVQRELIRVYRQNAALSQLCERLVDFDEGLQEWRYRHVKMVQRTIGTKHGTGGSHGAEYLLATLFKPAFPDLWAIRTEL